MKTYAKTALAAMAAGIILACSDTTEPDTPQPTTYDVSGKVEKGPFVSGSTITIQPLDGRLQTLGSLYSTTIDDNAGAFSFGNKTFGTPYAELMATGYFFNEVEGDLSGGTLVLRALVDLADRSTVNVNILTHLKYARIRHLVDGGTPFAKANTQAQQELLAAFGLQRYAAHDAAGFSIASGTDEAAALIAVSSLLLEGRSEGALTEYLASLSAEFAAGGVFSDKTKAQFRHDRQALLPRLADIGDHIVRRYADLGSEVTVKDLFGFFDWDDDGTAGNETLQEGQRVVLEQESLRVPKEGGTFALTVETPIPLYTAPPAETDQPTSSITPEQTFSSLYAGDLDEKSASVDVRLSGNRLTISVGPAARRDEESTDISLYDYRGQVVARVVLHIEGNPDLPLPAVGLGTDAQAFVAGIASQLGKGYAQFNLAEQFYAYNALIHQLPLDTHDGNVANAWSSFFQANNRLLLLRRQDEQQRNLFAAPTDVLYAIYYHTLTAAWGDVPYSYGRPWEGQTSIPRTDQAAIRDDLKQRLSAAIDQLEEKRNNCTGTVDDLFFVSKDVARIVLANLYLYEGQWEQAYPLLTQVRTNGYYPLDGTSEYLEAEATTRATQPTGVIFGLYTDVRQTRAQVVIRTPAFMPLQSITDVYLSEAECAYRTNHPDEATRLLADVAAAKGISLPEGDLLQGILEARKQLLLYNGGYLAFLKRNGLAESECDLEPYQLLLPIPSSECALNPAMTQNPGY
ncbi:MAG: hypothetical protein ACI36X_03855 [Bacteroidaceae bacterium]